MTTAEFIAFVLKVVKVKAVESSNYCLACFDGTDLVSNF